MKLFGKRWIFYFIIIFVVAFGAGFFYLNNFNNSASVFTASLTNSLPNSVPEEEIEPEVLSQTVVMTEQDRQNLLDDIQEKLDIIQQQVNELIAEQNKNNSSLPEVVVELPQDPVLEQVQEAIEPQNNQTTEVVNNFVGGGGVSMPVVYPKILISEVLISPIAQRFIELYNPNSTEVNLTGWYLQRKDSNDNSWGSLVSSTYFEDKTISPGGYFLISRQMAGSNILEDITLSLDNSLALKNPGREISDKLGFGNATDPEVLAAENPEESISIGRKVLENGEESETDNNSIDFELQTLTPNNKNIKYVEPPPPPPPTDTTAPEVIFSLAPIQTSIEFLVNFTITDIAETVSPSGLAIFNFRWKEESEGVWHEGGLQEIAGAPLSLDLLETVSGSDGQVFSFQAMAKDTVGNTSEWLPATPVETTIQLPVVSKNILINEVQISPIAQRFIELYNPNDFDVDLTGWYLQRKTQNADSWGSLVSGTHFEGKIIKAGGYFLISREIEGSDILLNITLSENNSLALKNSGREIVDKLGWGQAIDFEGVPAQEFVGGKSISRISGIDTDNNSVDFSILDIPTPNN